MPAGLDSEKMITNKIKHDTYMQGKLNKKMVKFEIDIILMMRNLEYLK